MRKPAAKTKPQIAVTGDQRLCFCYTDSTISLLPKYEISSLQPSSVARFVADVVGNPEDRFSHNEAQMISCLDCERGIRALAPRF